MNDRYIGDCVVHACAIAEALVADGRAAWIARLREVIATNGQEFHAPLIPRRMFGENALTWNVHYVACADGEAYDPIAGAPIAIDDYSVAIFGRDIPLQTHIDQSETQRLVAEGRLREAFSRNGKRSK